jgi:hypothetical protein
VGKRQSSKKRDVIGKRLQRLGLSCSETGWFALSLELRCLPEPVLVTFAGGPSGVHPLQLEAVERLVAEETSVVYDLTMEALHEDMQEWYQACAPGVRVPSLRAMRATAAVGMIDFPTPGKRGKPRPTFRLEATRSVEDEHPVCVYFAWGEAGWEVVKRA